SLRGNLQRTRAPAASQPALAFAQLQQCRPQRTAQMRLALAPVRAGTQPLATLTIDLLQIDAQCLQTLLAVCGQSQRTALLAQPVGCTHALEHANRQLAGQ